MVPAIVYMTAAGFFRPIVFMALKKMKSDITFYRIPISKTYEAPTFTHPIPFEPKKLHTVKEKLYGVQYQSVTQRTYLPFVGVCKRKVGIEKKETLHKQSPNLSPVFETELLLLFFSAW